LTCSVFSTCIYAEDDVNLDGQLENLRTQIQTNDTSVPEKIEYYKK
jgi:hypothetical protein